MYINPTRSYLDSHGEQFVHRALFLILLQREHQTDNGKGEIRAIVRMVALRQMGHWMVGCARVKGHRINISGAYGSDGLPRTVPDLVFYEGVPLTQELMEAWGKGGGWNDAGSEAPDMRAWARAHLPELYKVGRSRKGR